jgi:hypothetical protein
MRWKIGRKENTLGESPAGEELAGYFHAWKWVICI